MQPNYYSVCKGSRQETWSVAVNTSLFALDFPPGQEMPMTQFQRYCPQRNAWLKSYAQQKPLKQGMLFIYQCYRVGSNSVEEAILFTTAKWAKPINTTVWIHFKIYYQIFQLFSFLHSITSAFAPLSHYYAPYGHQ